MIFAPWGKWMRNLGLVTVLAVGLALGACKHHKREYVPPPSPFDGMTAITLDAGLVEVARRYRPDPLSIEAQTGTTFDEILEDYAEQRFVPHGGERTFRLVIRDAEIAEVGADRYEASMTVHIQMLDANRTVEGYSLAQASLARGLSPDLSISERAEAWKQLAIDLVMKLDAPLTDEVRNVLGAYIMTVEPAS